MLHTTVTLLTLLHHLDNLRDTSLIFCSHDLHGKDYMLVKRKIDAAAVPDISIGLSAFDATAQQRQRFDYWYGLTGQLGEVMAKHCKRFNESQTQYEAVYTDQGGYARAEQNTIAAHHARQHPTLVQIYDARTVNFMLSGATYNAVQLARDFHMKIDWNDYFPGVALYYAASRGEIWSFPYNSSFA